MIKRRIPRQKQEFSGITPKFAQEFSEFLKRFWAKQIVIFAPELPPHS